MTEFFTDVREALESGRLGFSDISTEGVTQMLKLAPTNQVFLVPSRLYIPIYKTHAISLNRRDIIFKVKRDLTFFGIGLLIPVPIVNSIADVPLWTTCLILTCSAIAIIGSKYGFFGENS